MSTRFRTLVLVLFVATFVTPLSTVSTAAQSPSCADFDTWIWAQALFDRDEEANADLDLDGNGIACDELPVAGFAPITWADGIPANVTPATVISISDGDTIKVQLPDGTTDTVRLLHIDTPETGGTIGQCGGTESTDYLTWILSYAKNGTVYLENDETARDRYDRRLAYVWFEVDGDPNPYMANDAMVLAGWAESEFFGSDVKYKEQLNASEQFSIEHVTGVRLLCGKFGQPANNASPSNEQIRTAWQKQPNQGRLPAFPQAVQERVGKQPPAAAPTAVPAQADAQSGECDPSYPGVCIPPAWQVGDLDCADVQYRRFTVVPLDSHNFDGNFDGVGCEGG